MGSGFFAACAWLKVGLYACRERQGGSGRLSRQVLPPLTLGERVGVRGGCSRLPFGSAPWLVCGKRQSGFGRLPAPESLLFAGPKRSNQEKWPDSIRRPYKQAVSKALDQRTSTHRPTAATPRRIWKPRNSFAALRFALYPPPLRAGEGWGGVLLLLRAWSALLFPGPLGDGEAGTRRPRSGRAHGWARLFDRAGGPAPTHALSVHGGTESVAAGCRFLLATSLLDKQKRSSSGAGRRTKPFCRSR